MNKVLIMDLDETLVWSRSYYPFEGCKSFYYKDDKYCTYTIARPEAREFLQHFQDKGIRIISLTQGVVDFQQQVIKGLGLDDLLDPDEIYGWKSVHRISVELPEIFQPPNEVDFKWVLVDNESHQGMLLGQKAEWLNSELHPGVNFIRCEEFRNSECQPLQDLIPEIERMLDEA